MHQKNFVTVWVFRMCTKCFKLVSNGNKLDSKRGINGYETIENFAEKLSDNLNLTISLQTLFIHLRIINSVH